MGVFVYNRIIFVLGYFVVVLYKVCGFFYVAGVLRYK